MIPSQTASGLIGFMKIARLPNGSPEIFRTLQGEGPSTGCPAVFLRLSLCNLHCIWCDTPFTWNWETTPWEHQDLKKFTQAEQILSLDTQTIAQALIEQAQPGDRLVLTGGEPLLQQKELTTLLPKIAKTFSEIEIETNGTQKPSQALDHLLTQYNVSPKLKNSANSESLRLCADALSFFSSSKKAYFKFVIQNENDLTEVLNLAQEFKISSPRILLMPEGRTSEELAQNRAWIAQACLQHCFRMTDRLHVQLWGDARGR